MRLAAHAGPGRAGLHVGMVFTSSTLAVALLPLDDTPAETDHMVSGRFFRNTILTIQAR